MPRETFRELIKDLTQAIREVAVELRLHNDAPEGERQRKAERERAQADLLRKAFRNRSGSTASGSTGTPARSFSDRARRPPA